MLMISPSIRAILKARKICFFNQIHTVTDKADITWFYATDIPKRSPYDDSIKQVDLSKKNPKTFLRFSEADSQKLEREFKKSLQNPIDDPKLKSNPKQPLISVNEDLLFHVDIKKMELQPTYWKGPIYEVRRGVWFDSSNRPLSMGLTNFLENKRNSILKKQPNLLGPKNNTHRINEDLPNEDTIFEIKEESSDLLANWDKIIFIDNNNALLFPTNKDSNSFLHYVKNYMENSNFNDAVKVTRKIVLPKNNDSPVFLKNSGVLDGVSQIGNRIGKISDIISHEINTILGMQVKDETKSLSSNPSDTIQQSAVATFNDVSEEIIQKSLELDFNNSKLNSKDQKRKIRHLFFCVHGVGQTLGKKYKYFNFTHTVNLLRSNMKKSYSNSKKLQELNYHKKYPDWETNCGVQLFPITWRHDIGFETDKTHVKHSKLPSLDHITINGIEGIRKLIADVALDVLLFCDPYYKELIIEGVRGQLNYVFELFKKNNPDFDGEVHLIGHSLGNLILFDLLNNTKKYSLNFKVGNYFCLGSPAGVFKLIQRTNIDGINNKAGKELGKRKKLKQKYQLEIDNWQTQTLPCKELYNIFHLCDPMAYRLEPLVCNEMAEYEQAFIPRWTEDNTISNLGLQNNVFDISDNIISNFFSNNQQTQQNSENQCLDKAILEKLKTLNSTGRIDYALPRNALGVNAISAVKAHVEYFEDMDIARFLLFETLREKENVMHAEVTPIR
ncbi:hypothetical protein TBLA_0J00730 [Henningerozyma blattae CBS 6284]|uniref:DDHD domain-containing protein n=1 Tax=Henningerozyma blattae (strain ATCC 34711 / CBS 6284 / DSM 70876 / NBRC 10599 / NRRL Y-10934 / UCD 77-7) TaxID=1071380 RepID=I2H9L9_HENB6|nr:hypothetical protein TBLA_0J00730 [Tetrapisispora blattae CBS 6284]CCH63071.1 hypothetical protein TBLA_0J00730 [Tetrapisispora blattae CBS 6284]